MIWKLCSLSMCNNSGLIDVFNRDVIVLRLNPFLFLYSVLYSSFFLERSASYQQGFAPLVHGNETPPRYCLALGSSKLGFVYLKGEQGLRFMTSQRLRDCMRERERESEVHTFFGYCRYVPPLVLSNRYVQGKMC